MEILEKVEEEVIYKTIQLTKELEEKFGMLDIPEIDDYQRYEHNKEKADERHLEHCPICGRAIPNPTYFFNSAYGGAMFVATEDADLYADCWVMGVGSECRKKLPKGYVFEIINGTKRIL